MAGVPSYQPDTVTVFISVDVNDCNDMYFISLGNKRHHKLNPTLVARVGPPRPFFILSALREP